MSRTSKDRPTDSSVFFKGKQGEAEDSNSPSRKSKRAKLKFMTKNELS
jgi:hypothetical protein